MTRVSEMAGNEDWSKSFDVTVWEGVLSYWDECKVALAGGGWVFLTDRYVPWPGNKEGLESWIMIRVRLSQILKIQKF